MSSYSPPCIPWLEFLSFVVSTACVRVDKSPFFVCVRAIRFLFIAVDQFETGFSFFLKNVLFVFARVAYVEAAPFLLCHVDQLRSSRYLVRQWNTLTFPSIQAYSSYVESKSASRISGVNSVFFGCTPETVISDLTSNWMGLLKPISFLTCFRVYSSWS